MFNSDIFNIYIYIYIYIYVCIQVRNLNKSFVRVSEGRPQTPKTSLKSLDTASLH